MDDVQKLLKENWPYVVGGIVGLFLIWRFMSGGSSTSSDSSGLYSAMAAANTAQMQASSQNAAIAAANEASQRDYNLNLKAIESKSQTDFILAQSAMAQAVGQSAAGVIGALYTPTITAINAATYENGVTMQSAAVVAASGFQSQADIVGHTSSVTQSVSEAVQSWQGVASGIAAIMAPKKSPLETIGNTVSNVASSMYGGGFLNSSANSGFLSNGSFRI